MSEINENIKEIDTQINNLKEYYYNGHTRKKVRRRHDQSFGVC